MQRRKLLSASGTLFAAPALFAAPTVDPEAKAASDTAGRTPQDPDDVLIIGAGGAGLAAAVSALEAGARRGTILERGAFVGGHTVISAGTVTIAAGGETPVEDLARDIIEAGGRPELARTFAENAGAAIQWLGSMGVAWEPRLFRAVGSGMSARRNLSTGSQRGGWDMIQALSERARTLGAKTLFETRACRLLLENGRVGGVAARTASGDEVLRNARAVVLATGGFGANPEMVKKYNPKIDERFKTTDAPGTTGEALYMAERAGAQLVNMGYIQTYPICDPISGAIELIADARFDGAIMLNQEGKRFVEELQRRDVLSEAILNQTGRYCWVLWNDKIGSISNTVKAHANEYEAFTKQGIMTTCDDLKCIADFTKIPFDQLQKTVKRVSDMAGKGNDKDFNHRSGLVDMQQGKYYVIKAVPSTHHTMGGVRINEKAEALTAEGKVIPGLWAAGEVTGVTHGTNRLGGNAYTDIIVFGRIAGEAAAKAAK